MHPTYDRCCWHVVCRCFIEVYNPRAVILHAASLHQTFVHCAKFPIAASRRSEGRVSVPLWPFVLSDRLPVIGLVGIYPANYLIGHRLILKRIAALILRSHRVLLQLSPGYPLLMGRFLCVTQPFATIQLSCDNKTVRLAYLRHAASVCPELGSNSQRNILFAFQLLNFERTFSYLYSLSQVFKELFSPHIQSVGENVRQITRGQATPYQNVIFMSTANCRPTNKPAKMLL